MASPVLLSDFKAYLNLTSNTGPGGDAELQAFLDAASDLIAFKVGSLTPAARVETHHGGAPVIVLDRPIASVTSVIEWIASTPYTLTEQDFASGSPVLGQYTFSVEGATGDDRRTLTRRAMGYPIRFAGGRDNIVVTYSAGWTTIPNPVVQGIKELGRLLFKSQQGSRNSGSAGISLSPGADLPDSVQMLIGPYAQTDGAVFG